MDLSVDARTWLDAVYTAWIDAPYEVLQKANVEMVKAIARLRPKEARETWGLLPEHQAMSGKLGKQQAPRTGPGGGTDKDIRAWQQQQALQRAKRSPRRG